MGGLSYAWSRGMKGELTQIWDRILGGNPYSVLEF